MATLEKYGKNAIFRGWDYTCGKDGFDFTCWDELEDHSKMIWVRKFIHEVTDPYTPARQKNVKVSRWKKNFMNEGLQDYQNNQVQCYYEHQCLVQKLKGDLVAENRMNINMENVILKRRVASLKTEVSLLQEENKTLNIAGELACKKIDVLQEENKKHLVCRQNAKNHLRRMKAEMKELKKRFSRESSE